MASRATPVINDDARDAGAFSVGFFLDAPLTATADLEVRYETLGWLRQSAIMRNLRSRLAEFLPGSGDRSRPRVHGVLSAWRAQENVLFQMRA
ncbi:MAG TPA: hypothetical protein VIF83_06150 [Gemmatimonadaceae bacterium]